MSIDKLPESFNKFESGIIESLDSLSQVRDLDFRKMTLAAGLNSAKDYVGADLTNVDFGASDLSGFNFFEENFTGSKLKHAKTMGARFDGAIGVDPWTRANSKRSAIFSEAYESYYKEKSKELEVKKIFSKYAEYEDTHIYTDIICEYTSIRRPFLLCLPMEMAIRVVRLGERPRAVPPKSVLVSESDTDEDVFLVLTGAVRMATFTDNGREVLYWDVGPGELFGEKAAFDGEPRMTNGFAKTHSRILRIPGREFREFVFSERRANVEFLKYLVGLARHMSVKYRIATTLTTQARIIVEIVRELKYTGRSREFVVERLPTQQEIATRAQMTQAIAGREMSKLLNKK